MKVECDIEGNHTFSGYQSAGYTADHISAWDYPLTNVGCELAVHAPHAGWKCKVILIVRPP